MVAIENGSFFIRRAIRGIDRNQHFLNSEAVCYCTAEDLPGLAFAGQQDTFLNVAGEEAVLDAVKRCWGSLWTARAIAYRARNRIPTEEVALAVVIQEMITAESSGVLFTANPMTGRRDEMIIEASFGLGEAIVSGQALREVRTAVAGYRQPSLSSELDGAREILEAAGITCTIDNAVGIVPSEADAALAWAIREGVTNVIRHSRARQCQIRLRCANETIRAEVHNDGYIGQSSDLVHIGSGLTGLTERFRMLGGYVQSGPALLAGNLGFRLVVKIPLPQAEAEQEQVS